ncbi:metal-sulfur cluster biosynthetic enzyme, partial [mine drainage metagenome]
NIVDLGLIYGFDWPSDGKVVVRMTMTSPGCPVGGMLADEVRTIATRIPGIREAEVRIVWTPPWSPERMTEATRRRFGYA